MLDNTQLSMQATRFLSHNQACIICALLAEAARTEPGNGVSVSYNVGFCCWWSRNYVKCRAVFCFQEAPERIWNWSESSCLAEGSIPRSSLESSWTSVGSSYRHSTKAPRGTAHRRRPRSGHQTYARGPSFRLLEWQTTSYRQQLPESVSKMTASRQLCASALRSSEVP